jgi:hypothetical protein
MAGHKSVFVRAVTLLLLVVCCHSAVRAGNSVPQRRGKVIIIRGAFTVFSLGLNELGDKLAKYGLDVEVIADISTDRATAELIAEYRRKPTTGPIIFVGHSRGAELGPQAAGELMAHKIPVKLIVMVDAVHPTTIPSNVERCVNLYHDSSIGLIHGVPARATSRRTEMKNVDINRLRSREQAGSINHFNIDSSSWVHDLVIKEVLKVCPVVESVETPKLARNSTPARKHLSAPPAAQEPARRPTQRQSPSGLKYPAGISGDLWADPTSELLTKPNRGKQEDP